MHLLSGTSIRLVQLDVGGGLEVPDVFHCHFHLLVS